MPLIKAYVILSIYGTKIVSSYRIPYRVCYDNDDDNHDCKNENEDDSNHKDICNISNYNSYDKKQWWQQWQ